MRVLVIHCDYFRYKLGRATKFAEEAKEREAELRDVLVLFTCIENGDERREKELVEGFISDMKETTKRIGCSRIILYPYAHLSSNLSSPNFAKEMLKNLKEALQREGFEVSQSPFGWYKEFELCCKGHPLAESYREF
jgi:threonyl-tRNA synthetase